MQLEDEAFTAWMQRLTEARRNREKTVTRKPYVFMKSCSVLLPSQIHMTKFTPHLGYFLQFNQRCGKN